LHKIEHITEEVRLNDAFVTDGLVFVAVNVERIFDQRAASLAGAIVIETRDVVAVIQLLLFVKPGFKQNYMRFVMAEQGVSFIEIILRNVVHNVPERADQVSVVSIPPMAHSTSAVTTV